MLKKLRNEGDTIVEVLICLVIVGSALTISYGIARRSLFQIRDGQERGEMLTAAQSMTERLKKYIDTHPNAHDTFTGTSILDRVFCISKSGTYTKGITAPDNSSANGCAINEKGEFYIDPPMNGDINEPDHTIVNRTHPYRIAIVYHPCPLSGDVPSPTCLGGVKPIHEFYIVAGRLGAGGHGNAKAFSVASIMYRQAP